MAPEIRLSRNRAARRVALAAMALVLLAAAGLRLAGLPDPPPGLHYDEAANIIMAREIAYRGALPVHIDAFEGREVVYFYLSALAIRLLGDGEFALRLAAAFCGVVAVAATYPAARHWFRSRAVGALAAALLAVSLWNVIHSRLALESITVATVQAAALALWGVGAAARALGAADGGGGGRRRPGNVHLLLRARLPAGDRGGLGRPAPRRGRPAAAPAPACRLRRGGPARDHAAGRVLRGAP
ncbi:MAG: glycosyltransferase family 39 protein [Anaerolineae bacterium]|nr:glycosyltransferase family 39 protein [Anaerolineae bacterium]